MANLAKNWRIWFLIIVLIMSFGVILFQGLNFGIDFKGGTLFQIHLSEKVSNDEIQRVTTIVSQRLNWTGLKDIKVYNWGNEFVVVQMAETNPEEVQKIESLLKKQGKFEVMTDGQLMFSGEDVIKVDQSTATGIPAVSGMQSGFQWMLPFVLKTSAAKNFRDLSFHKCVPVSFNDSGQNEYECDYTYFFIDRPKKSILVFDEDTKFIDESIFLAGNSLEGIPDNMELDEILLNIGVPYYVISDENISNETINLLKNDLNLADKAIIPETLSEQVKEILKEIGFELVEKPSLENIPWLWSVSGMKQIVRLQPGITGNKPYVETPEEAKIITDLIIQGYSQTQEEALAERDETKILLQAGSLPVSVESISKESISPLLGEDFLESAGLIGLIVLIVVALVLFFRYRNIQISLAIMFTSLVEAFVTIAFTSLTGNIDLAVIAGILAAVGTGVDDQIVITDELKKGEQTDSTSSLVSRAKRAFFIVIAAAVTVLATMLPIIFFGQSMVKLVGFAIATTVGVLVGVLVTRPAYSEIAQYILKK